ncbi:hypothetical protein [Thermodesulfatator autotrophicus]|uniref:Uncharacterized protein n=1 Tax=Thermodesulfatator autotrophicus TaxID=1795632 RepID=A0A177E7J3_9BACT|nr:hypothetical protein [Thermodesulfatator autotrophicus]OAG27914.1 hypothetical protein TH606_04590 [Thermodesulfatator autotrophicus]
MRYLRSKRPDPTRLIEEKIDTAKEIFIVWGDRLLKDPEIAPLLPKYVKAVENSNQAMEEAGTFHECYVCTVLEGKGCCKIGLENECTVLILLLNLMLGEDFPEEREVPGRCFFVGPRGCKILARPMLCRDYFCLRHLNMLSDKEMAHITQVLNEELTLLHRLTSLIRERLEDWTGKFLLEYDLTGY